MSGGHYEYKQCVLENLADDVEEDIIKNKRDKFYCQEFELFLEKLKKDLLDTAKLMKDVDWVLSGDSCDEAFLENREQEKLELIEANSKVFKRDEYNRIPFDKVIGVFKAKTLAGKFLSLNITRDMSDYDELHDDEAKRFLKEYDAWSLR